MGGNLKIILTTIGLNQLLEREASELKNVTKSGKSPQFSWHPRPLPQDVLDFEFGKNFKLEKFTFYEKTHKLKTLKII